MRAAEFLAYSGEHYEENKKKWTTRLKKQGYQFNEDIYNDTILKLFNYLEKNNVNVLDENNIEPFWYKFFTQNIKRDSKYSYHKRDDSVEVLQYLDNFPTEDRPILIEDIKEGLNVLTELEKNLLLMYYLTDITYTELGELTGIKDVRYRIKNILSKIKKKI